MLSTHEREVCKRAMPECSECGESILYTEIRWYQADDGEWGILYGAMVCSGGHRILIYGVG